MLTWIHGLSSETKTKKGTNDPQTTPPSRTSNTNSGTSRIVSNIKGIPGQILSNPFKKVNYINSIWIQNLLDFMEQFQIQIFTTTFFSINYQHQNDKCIMKEVCKLKWPKQKSIQLNACRMYLQVATLGDIINPDERSLNAHVIEGNTSIYPCSTFKWPNQPQPYPTA